MPTTTIMLPTDLGAQLDAVARARGSDSQEIALQAIRAFLAVEDDEITRVALAELDRGEGVPAEQVGEEMVALLEQHGISRADQATIRSRVAAELASE
jgi:predicted transcriptional regulator